MQPPLAERSLTGAAFSDSQGAGGVGDGSVCNLGQVGESDVIIYVSVANG